MHHAVGNTPEQKSFHRASARRSDDHQIRVEFRRSL
jgi:hypothetical protein